MSKREGPEDPGKTREDNRKNRLDKNPSPRHPPPGEEDPRNTDTTKKPGGRPRGG